MEMSLALPLLLLLLAVVILFSTRTVKSTNPGSSKTNSSDASTTKGSRRTYTLEEVRQHKSRDDCWIVIKNKVYDVTPYVEEHPGGDSILNNAGADSTEGFFGPQHVTRVFQMIDDFYIGDVQT